MQRLKSTEFKCRYCGETFQKMSLWDEHEQLKHDRYGPKIEKKFTPTIRSKCHICDEFWENVHSLNNHLRKFHDYDLKFGKLHKMGNPQGCLKCDHCPETFTVSSKLGLIRHLNNVHLKYNLKFKCHICWRTFENDDCLRDHIENVHNQEKFECKICSKSYKTKYKLQHHINGVHNKQYKCEKCYRYFGDPYGLNFHIDNTCAIMKEKKVPILKNEELLVDLKNSMEKIRLVDKCEFTGMSTF